MSVPSSSGETARETTTTSHVIDFMLSPAGPEMACYAEPIRISLEKPKDATERERMLNALMKLDGNPIPKKTDDFCGKSRSALKDKIMSLLEGVDPEDMKEEPSVEELDMKIAAVEDEMEHLKKQRKKDEKKYKEYDDQLKLLQTQRRSNPDCSGPSYAEETVAGGRKTGSEKSKSDDGLAVSQLDDCYGVPIHPENNPVIFAKRGSLERQSQNDGATTGDDLYALEDSPADSGPSSISSFGTESSSSDHLEEESQACGSYGKPFYPAVTGKSSTDGDNVYASDQPEGSIPVALLAQSPLGSTDSDSLESSDSCLNELGSVQSNSVEVNVDVVNSLTTQLLSGIASVKAIGSHGGMDRAFSYRKLASACDDFKHLGLSYSATAIREIGLRDYAKTLKVDKEIGGVAGGAKMVCINCIRLKNPELCQLPKQYDFKTYKARKAAKLEFHYTDMFFEALFNKDSPSDHIVLPAPCMLMHYLGHEFLVSLNLPLGSPVLGTSGTAPVAPICDDRNVSLVEFLNQFLKPLGLEKHGAVLRNSHGIVFSVPPSHFCALPFDAEVYKSKFQIDNYPPLFFVVDTARMMPPTFDSSTVSSFLYRHMRKEFVKWYYVERLNKRSGLSCDAFSKLSQPEDDEKVKQAYQVYLDCIPQIVADHLAKLEYVVFSDDLVRIVHYFGLNLRDLGRVYTILDRMEQESKEGEISYCGAWKRRIIVEIIARSFRRVADSIMFSYSTKPNCSIKDSDMRGMISLLFNAVLWSDDNMHSAIWEKIRVWKDECFPTLCRWGNPTPQDDLRVNVSVDDILKDGSLLESFLWISSNLLGVKWTLALWGNRKNPEFFKKETEPIDVRDVQGIEPRVLELNMAHHAHGIALCGLSREDGESNLDTMIHHFQEALDRQPTNTHSMDRLARSYRSRANLESNKVDANQERIRIWRKRADYLVEMASKVPDPDMDSVFAYGLDLMQSNCLCRDEEEKKQIDCAKDLFETAVANGHKHSKVMLSDLRYFCLRRPIEEVLESLKDIDGGNGCNAGFHKFVYLLKKGDLEAAVDVAVKIRTDPKLDKNSSGDKKRLEFIQEFQDKLRACLE